MKRRPLTIIESPYAGNVDANIEYAKRAVHDSLKRGEAPIASHLLFTQPGLLDDNDPQERAMGIAAGLEWYRAAELCAVYMDRGISPGMGLGIECAKHFGVKIDYRSLISDSTG